MNKPVGGRGKKAPYKTTVKRIPIDLEDQIDLMIEEYRANLIGESDRPKTSMLSLPLAIALAKKLIRAKNSKLDTIQKLVTGIYNTDSKIDI